MQNWFKNLQVIKTHTIVPIMTMITVRLEVVAFLYKTNQSGFKKPNVPESWDNNYWIISWYSKESKDLCQDLRNIWKNK
jgi:hypothetical protein